MLITMDQNNYKVQVGMEKMNLYNDFEQYFNSLKTTNGS